MLQRNLVNVVLALSRCRSIDEIVQTLRDSIRTVVDADGITIVLRDGDQCYYVEENAVAPLWKGRRFPMSACISGWCMHHREQVVVPDIYADARIPHDAYRTTFVKSLAMTPIRSADPVGAIGAYWAEQRMPTDEQLATLQALGDSAAMALANAQLIERLEDTSRRKDAFLSMLAHELRNPLAPIRTGLQLLSLDASDTELVQEAAQIMNRQVKHLSRIIDDLLDVSRMNSGKVTLHRQRLDLSMLLTQCVSDHRASVLAAKLSLTLQTPPEPVWVDGDATRLTQVITNLLDNARKYTPAGGSIVVRLTVDPAAPLAQIDVQDTGIGIAGPLLPRVFETFIQADTSLDRTGGGLGLGLSVAHGLTTLHGGSITALSEGAGRGSIFRVTLPLIPAPADASPPAADRAAGKGTTSSNQTRTRVLIIEDNRDAAHTLQTLLRRCGYEAAVAYDGEAGVEQANALRPDVVLCDIGLPRMDGYAVARALRSTPALAHARLLAVTGYGSDADRSQVQSAGFDGHLVKPVDIDELMLTIQGATLDAAAL